MKKRFLSLALMLVFGISMGLISKYLDYNTQILGNMFSETGIWVLICVIISVNSRDGLSAAANILPFCLGMLISYYIATIWTGGLYLKSIAFGWTVAAFLAAPASYIVRVSKSGEGFGATVSTLVLLGNICLHILLFQRFHIYDIFINAALIYFLFIYKKAYTKE